MKTLSLLLVAALGAACTNVDDDAPSSWSCTGPVTVEDSADRCSRRWTCGDAGYLYKCQHETTRDDCTCEGPEQTSPPDQPAGTTCSADDANGACGWRLPR